MPDRRLVLGRQDERRALRHARERRAHAVEQAADIVVCSIRASRRASRGRSSPRSRTSSKPVDEHPQAELGRDAAGADMRGCSADPRYSRSCITLRIVAAETFSRQAARERARADRLAVVEIAFDHAAEDLARAVVHLVEKMPAVCHVDCLHRGAIQQVARPASITPGRALPGAIWPCRPRPPLGKARAQHMRFWRAACGRRDES